MQMRTLLLCLLTLLSVVLAQQCVCQNNLTLTCEDDLDCDGPCLCPTTTNATIKLITTTPSPVDSAASEQQYVQATVDSLTDGESAGWVVLMMFSGFAFIGILFYIGWMRVV